MKVRDFEIYNAVYCGLCRSLGKTYGPLAKLSLTYDMTFVSLLSAALIPGCTGYEQKRCRANPLKKCSYCKDDSNIQELAAAATVALTDIKILDNIDDSGFFKATAFRFVRLFTKRWRKKAGKTFPEIEQIVTDYRLSQINAEQTPDCGIDLAAEPSAKAVSRILSLIDCEEKYRFILRRMGYCIGKWVYLCDTADDLEKDIKKNRFNPLKRELPEGKTPTEFAKERLMPIMNTCLDECARYSELLTVHKYKQILDNILYDGMSRRQEKIFEREKQDERPL